MFAGRPQFETFAQAVAQDLLRIDALIDRSPEIEGSKRRRSSPGALVASTPKRETGVSVASVPNARSTARVVMALAPTTRSTTACPGNLARASRLRKRLRPAAPRRRRQGRRGRNGWPSANFVQRAMARPPMPDPSPTTIASIDEHPAMEEADSGDSPSADFAIAARDALAALEAAQIGQLELALRFGETLDVAKDRLGHGQFRGWCTEFLRRSPSWCAAHLRLHRQRGDLEEARAWAVATDHRWAHVRSVERLLKVIAEWRASLPEGDVRAARAKRSARPSQKEIIADLATRLAEARGRLAKAEERLAEDEAEFVALGDPLPPEVEERAADLATATEGGAREELAALARQFHWRPRDFEQMCGALHISRRERRLARTRQPVDGSEASSETGEPAERCMSNREAADA